MERLVWTLTIVVSFSLAGIMVMESLRDASENPIATSIDMVPIQVHCKQ